MLKAIFKQRTSFFLLIALFVCGATRASAQATEFTYQGTLNDNSIPANGNYDFEFRLFAVSTEGTAIGTRTRLNVSVANGGFTAQLDFLPAAFNGADRFLEISVKPAGSPDPFTTLSPRQQITYAPYAFHSLDAKTADTATNSLNLGGSAANQFVLTGDARLTDARTPLSGSGNYIQNRTSQQTGIVNFNIQGGGTLGGSLLAFGPITTYAQYNLLGNRVLGIGGSGGSGSDSLFVGLGAGANNTGSDNSFLGRDAGLRNTTGSRNSFFGRDAGFNNVGGDRNSFFGYNAGPSSNADGNSFFGARAGEENSSGYGNTFIGSEAGLYNTTGNNNTFIGTGVGGACFLIGDCHNSSTGGRNTFVGAFSGTHNESGNSNTSLGAGAGVEANLHYATAIGADAGADHSNTVVLGRSLDDVIVPGELQIETLDTAGSTHLCINTSNRVAGCSSSLRYKTNVQTFFGSLDVVNRLRPITFDWKDGGMRDVGFGAEDVEKIEPLFVTHNKQGQVEGVKYDRINVVLVNAVKEQQGQLAQQQEKIKQQQERITQQQRQVDGLRKLVCLDHPHAEVCKNEN